MDLDFVVQDTDNLIDESLDGAKWVNSIVENLRKLSHPSIDTGETLDINDCLDATLSILTGNVPSQVNLLRQYGTLPRATGHLREINQVFFNALKNALQAARLTGMTTMLDDATGKIRQGVTTCEEVLRVFGPRNTTQIACPHCGALMEQRFHFCPYCGEELIRLCRQCRQLLARDWRHFPQCGDPIDAP